MQCIEVGKARVLEALTRVNVIDVVEAHIACAPLIEPQLEHRFCTGIYSRQLTLPANTINVSKIHKQEHFSIILSGTLCIYDEFDGGRIVTGPVVMKGFPGLRRVVLTKTEVVWITFHATDHTDLEKIEEQLIEPHDNPLRNPNFDDEVMGWLETAMENTIVESQGGAQ